MSFRRSIFLAVTLAVAATVLLEGVLDVVLDGVTITRADVPADVGEPYASAAPTTSSGHGRLLWDLLDIPVVLGVALVVAWTVTRWLARPLRRLTAATELVASQRFPEPLELPPGDDELAQLGRSFNAMAEAVRGYVDRERAFTRYASHELRTPLAAMRLQLERVDLGHAAAADVLPHIRRQAHRIEEILEALLAMTRSTEPAAAPRRLSEVVEDALASLDPDTRPRVTVTLEGTDVVVEHGPLLRQAMANLLDNALRHGGGSTTLHVAERHGAIEIRVIDDGPGVADQDVARLTEPFFRAGSPRAGTGLGLSLVALIVATLRGELRLRNTGSGLEAVMTVPRVAR